MGCVGLGHFSNAAVHCARRNSEEVLVVDEIRRVPIGALGTYNNF